MPQDDNFDAPISPVKAGLGCCCPRCGEGKLYKGFLEFAPACEKCDLDYSEFDSGDGPAVFIILIMGFIVVGLALVVEVRYHPPLWFHALIWTPVIIGGAIGLLRPAKGLMVAMQFQYKAREGKLD